MPRPVLALGGAAIVVLAAAAALNFPGANQPGPGVGGPPASSRSPSPTPPPSPTRTAPATGGLLEGSFVIEGDVPMAVTIPVPGWRYLADFGALEKGTEVANVPEATALFWLMRAETQFYVPADPCKVTSTRPDSPVTTIDDLAAALGGQASRDASEPVDGTVDGYEGKRITLHVPEDAAFTTCEEGEFVTLGDQTDPLLRYQQGPGQIDELTILDGDPHPRGQPRDRHGRPARYRPEARPLPRAAPAAGAACVAPEPGRPDGRRSGTWGTPSSTPGSTEPTR